jgi:outer membrane usher protein FimD/PapC
VRKDFRGLGQDLTATGGLLETASSMHFAKSVDYTGARLASNQQLLFRDEQLQGSNIELFLPKRSLVEIFRGKESDGQVIYSRVLDFGTVQIDTRNFPQGAYDIEIIVRDGGTVVSRETRPFIKTQNLPPRGKPQLSLELGEMRDELNSIGTPVAAASYRVRMTDWLGGGVGVEATRDDRVYEISLAAQKNMRLLGALGLVEASLTGAFADALKPAGMDGTLSWTNPLFSAGLIASKAYARSGSALPGSLALTARQSVSLNVSAPLTLYGYKFYSGFTGELSAAPATGHAYRYGPTLSYAFAPRRGYTPELKLELNRSSTDNRFLATFTVRNMDPVWSKSAEMDWTRAGSDDTYASRVSLGYTGKGTEYTDWRRKIDANLGLRLDPLYAEHAKSAQFASADAQYTGEFVRAKTFLEQSLSESGGTVGGEMESTLIWSPGNGMRATSLNTSSDMALAMVTVRGPRDSQIDITLDGITKAVARPGETVVLPLPAYQKVKLAARDHQGKGALRVKEDTQVIIGYPGNVAYREFTIVKSWVLTGFLQGADGKPLAVARFTLGRNVYYADDTGFFTLEEAAGKGDTLELAGQGFTCAAKMPDNLADTDSYADLGTVACK